MCSGRVDLEFILRAFSNGQDGVFIGGCRLGECNYVTQGNFDALGNTLLAKRILKHIGLNPERLSISFMNASDGIRLAESINEFSKAIRGLGPLGKGEGENDKGLQLKLDAIRKLVPYLRLVERERLRVPVKTEQAYNDFFASSEMDHLFKELVTDKLAISEIMMLLKEKSLSTGEIAESLGLNPSEVSRHMKTSSMHGLVRYDTEQKCYALA
jgi:coenzyme F420-reducing hydrogenase delta subunit